MLTGPEFWATLGFGGAIGGALTALAYRPLRDRAAATAIALLAGRKDPAPSGLRLAYSSLDHRAQPRRRAGTKPTRRSLTALNSSTRHGA